MSQTPSPRRRQKLAELISDDIKRWIATEGLTEGDRLPNEKTLMELYGCAKGTVREALKILEVEGLIALKTGPGGGAILRTPSMEPASRMLRNFLHFRSLDGHQVYQLRRLLEVEMAVSVVGRLNEEALTRLEDNMSACECHQLGEEDQRRQRFLELEFHNLLAEPVPTRCWPSCAASSTTCCAIWWWSRRPTCPSASSSMRPITAITGSWSRPSRAEDVERVRRLMDEHMRDAEFHMSALEAEVADQMLISQDALTTAADASPLLRLVDPGR